MKYLTMLLNSKLVQFWLRYKGKMQGNNYQIDKAPLVNIPIVKTPERGTLPVLLDYLNPLVLYKTPVIDGVQNHIIVDEVEQISNAIIFQFYFPEEFQSKGIAIEKHAKELFVPIEDLSEEEKLEQIKAVYEELRKKENPLRNQIKLMKIELKDLLLPILSV